jgi:hypothetical protein
LQDQNSGKKYTDGHDGGKTGHPLGIGQFPKDARFYRHRGHRYISSRCFDLAIKDFKKAKSRFCLFT